jgi:hypothetical protein
LAHATQVEDAGLQIGVAPEQSLSCTHPTQRFCVLHTGVAGVLVQSVFFSHCTHSFAMVSQIEAAMLVQSLFAVQMTHEPAFIPASPVTHAGPPGLPMQSALSAQARQVWVVVLHVGVMPLQLELNSQPTHVPVGKSHTAVPPVHAVAFVDEHWPQAPHTSHAGVAPLHCESELQATHEPLSQMGVSPPQSAPLRHWTQVFVGVQRGVAGGQFASATHATQSPAFAPVVAHSGVEPPQSAALAHARQVSAGVPQIGVGLAQLAFVRHPTQLLVATSQTGVAPVHAVWFVAEQIAQMPDVEQAGVAPVHAESPSQAHGTPAVLSSSS